MRVNLLKCSLYLIFSLGLHPHKVGNRFQNFLFFSSMCANSLLTYFTILKFISGDNLSLTDIVDDVGNLLAACHGAMKATCLYLQRQKLRDLVDRFSTFRRIEDSQGQHNSPCLKTMRILKPLVNVYFTVVAFGTVTYIMTPLLRGTYIFLTYIPESLPYKYFTMIQIYMYVFGTVFPIATFDLFFINMVLLCKEQFELLNSNIVQIFPDNSVEDGEIATRRRVRKWVDEHNFLLGFVELFNEIFSMSLCLYFGIVVLSLCIQMFMLSTQQTFASSLNNCIYIMAIVCPFVVYYCFPSQILTDEIEKIPDDIWICGWNKYKLSSTVKTALQMILMRSQKKTFVRAEIVNATYETSVNVLKTVFSYYMFLKTMTGE